MTTFYCHAAVCNADFRAKTFVLMFLENGGGSSSNAELAIGNPGTYATEVKFSVFSPDDTSLDEKDQTVHDKHVIILLPLIQLFSSIEHHKLYTLNYLTSL